MRLLLWQLSFRQHMCHFEIPSLPSKHCSNFCEGILELVFQCNLWPALCISLLPVMQLRFCVCFYLYSCNVNNSAWLDKLKKQGGVGSLAISKDALRTSQNIYRKSRCKHYGVYSGNVWGLGFWNSHHRTSQWLEIVYYILGHEVGIQTFLLGYSLVRGCRDLPLQRRWLCSVAGKALRLYLLCHCCLLESWGCLGRREKSFPLRNQFTPSLPFYMGSAFVQCQLFHS